MNAAISLSTVAKTHADPEVIVFNLKKRFSGVSATVNALVPLQLSQWKLGYCGNTLVNGVLGMGLRQAIRVSKVPPAGRPFRIWHVRRDPEMMAGIWARDVLRLPIRLVFTSAAQHLHGRFPRWLISKMDAVIATTPLASTYVPNTVAVIPHGIELSRFAAPADKLHAWSEAGLPGRYGVGVFGRIRPTKGTDVFVDAMIQALPQLPDVTAVIVGLAKPKEQAYQDALVEKIAAAGLSERIVFLGFVPEGQELEWYKRCLVCVACPRYEPFGLTPFEAAAAGCALICSRTGAFDQLALPGQTGEMVDTGDAKGLATAFVNLMRDPENAAQMGAAARQRVTEHFSLEREAQAIGQVYANLFAAHQA